MPFLELEGKPDLEANPHAVEGELTVGSGSQATWRIPGHDLAARHFRVHANGDASATVAPVSPQHVVVLNGAQVPPGGTPLATGDLVAAGSASFLFLDRRDAPRPAPADPAPEAHLIDYAAHKGYTLRKRVVQIGREIGCSIVLKDPTVSRFHADVRSEGGAYVVYSMGSAGTKIRGERVTAPRMLVEGDEIAIGDTIFTYTRQPLGPGIRPVQFEDHADDAFSRRATQLAQPAITGEFGRRRSTPRLPWPWLAAAAVALLAIVYFTLR